LGANLPQIRVELTDERQADRLAELDGLDIFTDGFLVGEGKGFEPFAGRLVPGRCSVEHDSDFLLGSHRERVYQNRYRIARAIGEKVLFRFCGLKEHVDVFQYGFLLCGRKFFYSLHASSDLNYVP